MSVRRFWVDPILWSAEEIKLSPDEAAHALLVLRLKEGQEVQLLDGQGRLARAELSRIEGRQVFCQIREELPWVPPRPRLSICPGLCKPAVMDWLSQKFTELLVDEVRPWRAERSLQSNARPERWQRLADQALKQCGAPRSPKFYEPLPLADLLALVPATSIRLWLYEQASQPTLSQMLAGLDNPDDLWLFLGPEGGFSPQEATLLKQNRFIPCALPGAILRAETANLAAAAIIRLGWPQ